jgi:hypothetical protein
MPDDSEAARREAQEAHRRNQQTPMATEQDIGNLDTRNAYNNELARQREQNNR